MLPGTLRRYPYMCVALYMVPEMLTVDLRHEVDIIEIERGVRSRPRHLFHILHHILHALRLEVVWCNASYSIYSHGLGMLCL